MSVMSGKISCKKAVDYVSRKEEGKLSSGQRFALWRHLKECSLCRIFSVQNAIIGKAIAQHETKELTPAEKAGIIKSVLESAE